MYVCVSDDYVCVCVCVCTCARERERERERERDVKEVTHCLTYNSSRISLYYQLSTELITTSHSSDEWPQQLHVQTMIQCTYIS